MISDAGCFGNVGEGAVSVVAEQPAGSSISGLRGYVGEGTVSVVVIQNAAAVLRHIDIGESVAIIVANSHALAKSPCSHAGFLGDVGKRSVAVVSIQSVSQWRVGCV